MALLGDQNHSRSDGSQQRRGIGRILRFMSDRLEEVTRLFFWFGKLFIVQVSVIFLVIEGLITCGMATKSLWDLLRHIILPTHSPGSVDIQYETIGVMESYLSAIVLFILAVGLYGIFHRPDDALPLPIEIESVEELDSYLFGAIASVLIVVALREILSTAGAETATPLNWSIILAVCALVVVISIYLVGEKATKQ